MKPKKPFNRSFAFFESFVIAEVFKYNYNHNEVPQIYFWRDVQGHEVDVLIEKSFEEIIPIEMKAGMTITNSSFKGLEQWQKISKQENQAYLVYAGSESFEQKGVHIFTWDSIDDMLQKILYL